MADVAVVKATAEVAAAAKPARVVATFGRKSAEEGKGAKGRRTLEGTVRRAGCEE